MHVNALQDQWLRGEVEPLVETRIRFFVKPGEVIGTYIRPASGSLILSTGTLHLLITPRATDPIRNPSITP